VKLFTRAQTSRSSATTGMGTPGGTAACDYIKAPFFNVLAAFWIQFMTHDWFSHLDEGENSPEMRMGCATSGSTAHGGNSPRTRSPRSAAARRQDGSIPLR
jgi:hypothetical protein